MNAELTKSAEYINFIKGIKLQIKNAQIKAATTVNKELLKLYWNLAKNIIEKQEATSWGEGVLSAIAKDLKKNSLI